MNCPADDRGFEFSNFSVAAAEARAQGCPVCGRRATSSKSNDSPSGNTLFTTSHESEHKRNCRGCEYILGRATDRGSRAAQFMVLAPARHPTRLSWIVSSQLATRLIDSPLGSLGLSEFGLSEASSRSTPFSLASSLFGTYAYQRGRTGYKEKNSRHLEEKWGAQAVLNIPQDEENWLLSFEYLSTGLSPRVRDVSQESCRACLTPSLSHWLVRRKVKAIHPRLDIS